MIEDTSAHGLIRVMFLSILKDPSEQVRVGHVDVSCGLMIHRWWKNTATQYHWLVRC